MPDISGEVLTIRLLLAHWPDDSYILRGVAAQWGNGAADQVKQSLARRRALLEAEGQTAESEKRSD